MVENIINFNYSYPGFNELNSIITDIKLEYQKEIKKVYDIYNKLLKNFDEELYYRMSSLQKDIVIEYIIKYLIFTLKNYLFFIS